MPVYQWNTVRFRLLWPLLLLQILSGQSLAHTGFNLAWQFIIRFRLGFHMTIFFWVLRNAFCSSAKTRSVPSTHDLPLKLLILFAFESTQLACLVQPIQLRVTFSKVQSSKLERLFCHVSVKRDVRVLSFELWNRIQKCHPKWDWLYIRNLAFFLFFLGFEDPT